MTSLPQGVIQIDEQMAKLVNGALFAGGELMANEAVLSMQRGRKEVVNKKNHVPSKPGEPPAILEGDLRRGIEVVNVAPFEVHVTSKDRKAVWLEYGTSKMAARPYFRPARDKVRDEVNDLVRKAVNKALRTVWKG
jgi:hypothetical protein